MEPLLLAASLRARENFELINEWVNIKASTYSKPFQVLMAKISDYYARDGTATEVVPSILMAQIQETIRNDKHIERFQLLIDDALAATSSDANVRHIVLSAKQQEIGDKLAVELTKNGDKVDELMEEYNKLREATTLDDLMEEGTEVYENVNLRELIFVESDGSCTIRFYPRVLNDKLEGGVKRGHHITVFARPETGKTAFCVNLACGFVRQGLRVLYLINEDRPQDILLRCVSNLTGLNKRGIYDNPEQADELARERGFHNLVVISIAPGTPRQIEELIDEHAPDVVIVDQLRNLQVRADNRVNQLEYAATACRNIGKKKNVLMVSVTQAGDSADGKAVLELGDVDYSNTGIPAQADVLIGIGMTPEMEAENTRCISLPKNKVSGVHESMMVRINPQLSRLGSVE